MTAPRKRRCLVVLLTVLISMACQTTQLTAEPQPVHSQINGYLCTKRTAMINYLKTRYAEQPAFRGLAANGSVLEVMTAARGTWSILITTPEGITCLTAAGEHWQDIKQQEVDTPS